LAEPQSEPGDAINGAGREVELKFLLAEADFMAAWQWAGLGEGRASPPRAKRLKSVYFDTAEDDLAHQGMVLRMRGQGTRHVMTCKWQDGVGGVFERGEVEVLMAAPEPDPALLGADIAAAIAALAGELPGWRLVVTADRELRGRCRSAGASVTGPSWLLGLL